MPHLWILDYTDEIEADFIVFYRVVDIRREAWLDGPRFLRLANQLPLYEGAVRQKMTTEVQQQQMSESGESNASEGGFTPGQTMSMGEALARSQGNEMAVLDSLSKDSSNAGLGDLFEYETA
jgi:hypothetical protein